MTTPILSVLAERPRHHDLLGLQSVGDVQILDAPLDTLGRADLVVACADGAMLGIVYLDQVALLSAIRTKELAGRLIGVKQRWPWAYLLLGFLPAVSADGRLRNTAGASAGWAWDAVQGALLTAQEIGVGVLYLQHADHLERTIGQLARRDRGPARALPLRDGLFYSEACQILMGIPGIGESKADALVAQCGSAAAALQALTDDSMSLPGVGPETRKAARAALGLGPSEALGPYPTTPARKAA
jgi:hypothetical protein